MKGRAGYGNGGLRWVQPRRAQARGSFSGCCSWRPDCAATRLSEARSIPDQPSAVGTAPGTLIDQQPQLNASNRAAKDDGSRRSHEDRNGPEARARLHEAYRSA